VRWKKDRIGAIVIRSERHLTHLLCESSDVFCLHFQESGGSEFSDRPHGRFLADLKGRDRVGEGIGTGRKGKIGGRKGNRGRRKGKERGREGKGGGRLIGEGGEVE
jgi:hypothetical protein